MSNKDYYLSKLHGYILLIMDEIHRICVENSLRYYLCGGSLLGAIRHNGFIPWDDDLDIAMPRESFNKFIRLFREKANKEFYLEWATTNKRYSRQFAKVCIKNSLFEENYSDNKNLNCDWGIFVDIFPIDETCDDIPLLKRRKRRFSRWCAVLNNKNNYSAFTLPKRAIAVLLPWRLCHWMLYKISTKKDREIKNYTRFGSQYAVERVSYPIETFGAGRLHKFEDRHYFVPVDYDYQLTTMFGKNYMEVPPKNKQRSHYPHIVRFPDGIEMLFEKADKEVTIEDTLG